MTMAKNPVVPEKVTDEVANIITNQTPCYVHRRSFEIRVLPDEIINEEWSENSCRKSYVADNNYFKIEPLNSDRMFRVMMDFALAQSDDELRMKLIKSLNHADPLQNFQNTIDFTGLSLFDWYNYLLTVTKEWVKEQLMVEENHN